MVYIDKRRARLKGGYVNGISLTWWTLQIKLDGVYTGLSHIEPVPGVYLLGDHSRDGYTCRAAGQADNMQEVVKHLAVAHPDPSIFAWLRKEEQVALAWAGVQEQVRRAQIA